MVPKFLNLYQVTFVLMPYWLGATRMILEEVQSNEMRFYS